MLFGGIIFSCAKEDSELKNKVEQIDARLTELEQFVQKLNTNLSALSVTLEAIKNQDQVTSVTPLADGTGYVVSFSQSGSITIYNGKNGENGADGNDGTSPVIDITTENGITYWTLNGKIMVDNAGNKIPVTIKPEIRINEGNFEVSYDGGTSWTIIGTAGSGSANPSGLIFTNVENNAKEVIFTLANGQTIIIPKAQVFTLNVDATRITMLPGGMAILRYSITAADDATVVECIATGGFQVTVMNESASQGMLEIVAPNPLTDGKLYFFAVNGEGVTSMRIITFEAGEMKIAYDVTPISSEGGLVEIQVTTNLEYDIDIPSEASSWISYVETKVKRTENIVLSISANTGSEPRSATIYLYDVEEGEELGSFTIAQQAGEKTSDGYFNSINDWERSGKIIF